MDLLVLGDLGAHNREKIMLKTRKLEAQGFELAKGISQIDECSSAMAELACTLSAMPSMPIISPGR